MCDDENNIQNYKNNNNGYNILPVGYVWEQYIYCIFHFFKLYSTSPITKYLFSEKTNGGPLTSPGEETTLTIRGLNPKTRYFFRVKCENALGESQYGAEVAVTTLEERRYRDFSVLFRRRYFILYCQNVKFSCEFVFLLLPFYVFVKGKEFLFAYNKHY